MPQRSGSLIAFAALASVALLQAVWVPLLGRLAPAPTRAGETPQRIVIFPPVLWSYVTLQQSADHVVGVAHYLAHDARDSLLDVIYPRLTGIDVVATRGALTAIPASPEELLRLSPDLVITWKSFAAPLRAAGLPLLELTTNRKSERVAMLSQWQAIAKATGRQQREGLLVEQYRQRLSSIQLEKEPTKPSALVISRLAAGTFLSNASEELAVAGGTRPPGVAQAGKLGDEELLRINPEYVFLRCCAGADDTPAAFYADARFGPLSAVWRHRIYLEPSGSFHMEGLVHEPLLDEWIAELLHPNRPSILRNDLISAYQKEYRIHLESHQTDQLLHYSDNKISYDYDRFSH